MKSLYEQMGGTYTEVNGYRLPDLTVPRPEPRPAGKWGRLHEAYLKEHRSITYTMLLTSCKLDGYLADIQEEAAEMMERLITQMAKSEGITEKLKEKNQLEWVRRMNSIRNRAKEIVLAELIYQ